MSGSIAFQIVAGTLFTIAALVAGVYNWLKL